MVLAEDIYRYRKYLFTVAYNLTGDIYLSEDLVMESFQKWMSADRSQVVNAKAYLTKILIHEGFKVLEKQKKEKELYKGLWLPEPIFSESTVENTSGDPDPLDYAFLCLLERLDPYERTIVVLREAFDYSYRELAEILDIKEDNCRQVLHRAKEKLKKEPKKKQVEEKGEKALMMAFLQAINTGDIKSLEDILLQDVAFYSDGGGKVPTALKPLFGFEKVVKFFMGVMQIPTEMVFTAKPIVINGSPGVIILEDGKFNSMMILETEEGKVSAIYSMRNPDKIKF